MATLARPISPAAEKTGHIPWYLWCSALAVTSVSIGAHWDVSWHRTVGRDTFWPEDDTARPGQRESQQPFAIGGNPIL